MLLSYATQSNNSSNTIHQNAPSHYVGDLMDLYNKMIHEEKTNKLLTRKIEEANRLIDIFVEDREKKSYTLFCTENYNEALNNINSIKQNSEFLITALTFVLKFSKDKGMKRLIESSIETMQGFIIKLIDFGDLYQDLKSFEGEIDEDSEGYNLKMEQIADYISSANKRKVGNSIKELLAL